MPLADLCFTDPPYYDFIPYDALSQVFRAWLPEQCLVAEPLLPTGDDPVAAFGIVQDELAAYGEGLIAVLLPDAVDDTCAVQLRRLREVFGTNAYVALTLRRRPNDQLRIHELANLATQMRVPSVVTK